MPALSIADVLTHYGGDLTRISESGWRPIRCPFHSDRVKSASVNIEQNGFKCHGCEAKGDAIGLIMMRENLDFGAANEWAESVLGASVGRVREPASKPPPAAWLSKLFE